MSITTTIAKKLTNYSDSNSFGSRLRAKRLAPLLSFIKKIFDEYGKVDVIDIGGTKEYWNIVPSHVMKEMNVHITLVNLPDVEKLSDTEHFSHVEVDGCDLSIFKDKAFHIAHSNSTIEHVGDWSKMVQFSKELSRVAKYFFIQTPNYWFPIEPHCLLPFYHWLPKPARIWLVAHFKLGHWKKADSVDMAVRIVESARLLNKKMFRELFSKAEIKVERFLFLPKSFIAINFKLR